MSAKTCICKGQPLHVLIGAWSQRSKAAVAQGVANGKATDFKTLQLTGMLVRKLSEGTSMPFDARYRNLDHHLPDCPCSPRFQPPAPAGSAP